MRPLPTALQAHLDARVTTLCRCFRIERSDGAVLGFTDHDRPLVFDGTDFEPADGLDASEDVSGTGFAVGGMEVLGRADLGPARPGRPRGGPLRQCRGERPPRQLVDAVGAVSASRRALGEVTREDGAFRAEIRGLAAALDETRGRAFRPTCDADLGDSRCGIDLDDPDFRGTGYGDGGERPPAVHDERAVGIRLGLVRARPADLYERRECRPRRRGADASQGGRPGGDRAVAADAP